MYHITNLALVNGGSLRVDASLAVGSMREHIVVTPQGAPKPQAAVSTASTQPIRVGGMVKAAALTRQVKPAYPADLLAQGVEATVLLQAIISKEGVPQSLTVQNAGINQEFIDAAMAAVRKWRFRPTTLNGEPIEVATTVQVDFKLDRAAPVIDDRIRESPIGKQLK
jgi:TonB family protein